MFNSATPAPEHRATVSQVYKIIEELAAKLEGKVPLFALSAGTRDICLHFGWTPGEIATYGMQLSQLPLTK